LAGTPGIDAAVPCFPGGALALTGDRSTIYAATFGRGIYKMGSNSLMTTLLTRPKLSRSDLGAAAGRAGAAENRDERITLPVL
jgi:hypothetical protein